ncbi:hypothetical protein H257_19441 [Aphanomyces astaci]|uniref:Uncharacterized protein n=1 Tax=Aphanomyces astaci TaxID=112090 RepID=W4F836_APHAT|nr:hypothetical protein H257_19441 [Aphanomyces astaci]ETV63630.1 hypothetical protein H257_19441 [Aphanomyces astaci]|eukprot:XP_009846887.1 hypothetical protein H257_19441 [Aphanomyces astaci]
MESAPNCHFKQCSPCSASSRARGVLSLWTLLELGHLKEGIKQAKMYQFPSDQLDLYRVEGLVQGQDGQFLLNGNPIDLTRASLDSYGGHKANMPAASLISECFDTTSAPLARKIHVVVARLDDFPNTSYKRWTKLDAAMDQYKSWHGGVYGAPLADVSWSDVGWVFDKCTSHQELPREVIAPDHMGALYACLKLGTKALGGVVGSNESTRLFFITSTLVHVACLCMDNSTLCYGVALQASASCK